MGVNSGKTKDERPMASDNANANHASSDIVSMTGVAGRYAAALFDLASEAGQADAVETELNSIRASINSSPDLRAFINSPVYGRDDQLSAVTALAQKAGYSATTANFLKLVASNRRLFALEPIIDSYMARAAKARGEVAAEATSAAPMNDDQIKALRMEIESMIGKAVNLQTRVDPGLLGGLVVKVGSKMIDSSLRTKLNKLRTVMKEA